MSRARLAAILAFGAGGWACAYYNGLYNARQLERQARVAEREGRRAEARSLWIQASVKAESVVVRHPGSRYRDDALWLLGLARSRIGDCGDALEPLHEVAEASPDSALRAESRLLLGECWLEVGRPAMSREVLQPLAHGPDAALMSRVYMLVGRAWLREGRPDSALAYLRRSAEPEAQYDRAVTLLALDQVREAALVIDSTGRLGYDERRWEEVLSLIGAVDHRIADGLVDRLRAQGTLTAGQEARLLLADGVRWSTRDPARARTRFEAAVTVAGDSLEAGVAAGRLAVLEFRRVSDLTALNGFRDRLAEVLGAGGPAGSFVAPYALLIDEVLLELDRSPGDPIRLFRRAEEVRDSLKARPLAGALFAEVVRRNPGSTIAPKALLAVADLRPAAADSVLLVLASTYPGSPYTQVVLGRPAPGFAAVEDSLRGLLDAVALPNVVRPDPMSRRRDPAQ